MQGNGAYREGGQNFSSQRFDGSPEGSIAIICGGRVPRGGQILSAWDFQICTAPPHAVKNDRSPVWLGCTQYLDATNKNGSYLSTQCKEVIFLPIRLTSHYYIFVHNQLDYSIIRLYNLSKAFIFSDFHQQPMGELREWKNIPNDKPDIWGSYLSSTGR